MTRARPAKTPPSDRTSRLGFAVDSRRRPDDEFGPGRYLLGNVNLSGLAEVPLAVEAPSLLAVRLRKVDAIPRIAAWWPSNDVSFVIQVSVCGRRYRNSTIGACYRHCRLAPV